MVKRKRKKGFFKFGRNPLKIWQAWVGAFLALFVPIPLSGNLFDILNYQCILLVLETTSPIAIFNSIMGIFVLLSGFFFGASIKKGRDNFFQYGVAFLIIAVILFFLIGSGLGGGF